MSRYAVIRETPGKHFFETEADADAEATRLAKAEPGTTFYVARVYSQLEAREPVVVAWRDAPEPPEAPTWLRLFPFHMPGVLW